MFANQRESVQKTLTTNHTNVLTAIYQEDMPFTSTWAVDAYIVGAVLTSGDQMRRTMSGLFFRTSGGPANGSTSVVLSITSDAGLTADMVPSGNGVQVRVTDGNLGIASWNAVVVIQEISL